MTWITGLVWMCDGCGNEQHVRFGEPPVRRTRNKHHRRHKAREVLGTKYVHYCSDECAEEADASEVRAAIKLTQPLTEEDIAGLFPGAKNSLK